MQTEFDHMSTDALQMFVICERNADRLSWDAQQRLGRAEQALSNRKETEVVETVGPFRSELVAKINRPTLAKYAAMLGRDSIAADALAVFDAIRDAGNKAQAYRTSNGFKIYRAGVQEYPRPVLR